MAVNLAFGKTDVNSLWRIYMFNDRLLNYGMDIDDIRRDNICLLEKEAGSPRSTAERCEMSYSQYINLRDGAKDPRSGKPRGMRKETAWRFEDAFGKPRGWLDQPHSQTETQPIRVEEERAIYPVKPRFSRPLVQKVADIAETIDDAGLADLVNIALCLATSHPVVKAKQA